MSEKKKIKIRKSTCTKAIETGANSTQDQTAKKVIEDIHAVTPGSTISDPDDGQLDFNFLDFGSFFDSSDPGDAK